MSAAVVGWDERTVRYALQKPQPLNVIFCAPDGVEMVRIARDGFYVRGERVDQGAEEGRRVYRAFIAWMRAQGMAV